MTDPKVPRQRRIIDRRKLAAAVEALAEQQGEKARPAVLKVLREALEKGRDELSQRLLDRPSAGHQITAGHAFLVDQLVRVIFDHVTTHLYPVANRSSSERIAVLAVGGYGRAEMAPQSDVDIAFLHPSRRTPWCEQVTEAMLYFLWDLGFKVGQSSRTPEDMVRMAREDLTIRTALLEARFVWGDRELYDEARKRFWSEVVNGTERQFVAEKLAERDARHERMGGTRYVVEPNVKEGKGGLRDLQTLYWIGKYIHRARGAAELVDAGLLTETEYHGFRRAEGFLLAVRCHLHEITGRPEDRLTFDFQKQIAERMRFAERREKSAVERFMQYYFLQVKRVGSLTGVFLAQMDQQFARKRARTGLLAGFNAKSRMLKGYTVFGGKIAAPGDNWFRDDPVRLIEIFQLAEANGLEIDPRSMRQADRDSVLIKDQVRNDPRANAIFLDLLCGRNDPETALRWMNEAGVFGKFVPDFGRVNAQMQFNMYHHYTVDEHTIRAIGFLSKIEKGELAKEHPRSTREIHKVKSRRVAFVAALLHDIAKGRGGDHSILGAEVAEELCPRFGLDEDETDLVAWLVLQHLLMSSTAQKRDLTDPKTIEDFVAEVQSLERLRHLAILTSVDIRAVGPGTWNSWKGQLLGELYDAAHERLRLGHMKHHRSERVAAKKEAVREALGGKAALLEKHGRLLPDSYWIAEPENVISRNIVQYDVAREISEDLSIHCEFDEERGATLVTVIAADHPGLFYRIAGGIHLAGGNIIDARIHTTRNGWAIDNYLVQDPVGQPFAEERQLARIEQAIADAIANRGELVPKLAKRPLKQTRAGAFDVRPRVLFDNDASGRFTVIEVNARDRAALLNRLGRALFENQVIVQSAHITAYGERAADTFYVTDLTGAKITDESRMDTIRQALLDAASDARQAELEPA
ncbi:[protein-PII] uridylyltransferase [Erythrobacter litoralis]|uniref:Bifunctional uridylyltransferase/uridylyl-removing enzyme n=1 Tax=Erythrobacter litoralis (strain HTCC2594) TaxID=314225 RepID=GLND_ERYLH|nr:[protein-PII] uridylyltransferase [Erythrobacter litoralis]Q2N784.1 RecName: Full=Bifunctional uridylyltransferase/uridylyl-removing enzyme; Short=UTase/UR; AltName: Full=Bifunctional [protein-PII] modification enzyme; AltName: Full=Bifunctional nitrogen sensor protein; Includes: RecName: Full=[Protein-PII] uridylyltransferase; Short=PII uridylyltransferase; Short=UTase; Includes: RecName: Full=[Protein-PII]-UMP uridylyl-removing enzyme; Short=UR [Erythrobacter litoralis HTCC2594]ABC64457.1 ur